MTADNTASLVAFEDAFDAVLDGLTTSGSRFELPKVVLQGCQVVYDRAQAVDDLQVRPDEVLQHALQGVELLGDVGALPGFGLGDQEVHQRFGIAHAGGHLDCSQSIDGGLLVGVRHVNLLAVARAVTRYVAGTLFLAAFWQLQRKAWVRRAADSSPRPSDTTKAAS